MYNGDSGAKKKLPEILLAFLCLHLFIYSKLCEVPNRYGEKRFRVCMHSGASRLLGESSF